MPDGDAGAGSGSYGVFLGFQLDDEETAAAGSSRSLP